MILNILNGIPVATQLRGNHLLRVIALLGILARSVFQRAA